MNAADNWLANDSRPRFFPVAEADRLGLEPTARRAGVAVRTWASSLAGMQKVALVRNSRHDVVWRLVSDEGPYLNGHDEAPFPLAHMAAGVVASYANEVLALAEERGIEPRDFRLILHNYYTMEGSALKGTMTGGALPPELDLEADSDASVDALRQVVVDAVDASPVNGLVRKAPGSVFTLMANGSRVPTGRVTELDKPAEPDPGPAFDAVVPEEAAAQPLVELLVPADRVTGHGGVSSSYAESQRRMLDVRAVCTRREDGIKQIDVHLHQPVGSTFRFLSEEGAPGEGRGRAPDALTYVAAGMAFCFMTQFGRFAKISKKRLDAYRVVQDMYLFGGRASGETGAPGHADPVETHVFIDTPEGDDFARNVLDMSEQTCFLHALCRTELEPGVRLGAASRRAGARHR